MVASALYVTVDAWTLRCLFNRGRYPERIAANEFEATLGKPRKAPAKYNLGEGGISREVYYRHRQTGVLIVRVHRFEKTDGTFRDGDMPDPKELRENDIEYHLHPGGRWWHRVRREPEKLLPLLQLKRLYGAFRRFTCRRWGW